MFDSENKLSHKCANPRPTYQDLIAPIEGTHEKVLIIQVTPRTEGSIFDNVAEENLVMALPQIDLTAYIQDATIENLVIGELTGYIS